MLLAAVLELGTEVGGMDTPIAIDPDTGRPWRVTMWHAAFIA